MKGRLAQQQPDSENYSGLKVMRSAAGYYIGTEYYDEELDITMPGSRESGYYGTAEEAQAELDSMNWDQRERP